MLDTGSSAECGGASRGVHCVLREPKVCESNVPVLVQQDVLWLQIAAPTSCKGDGKRRKETRSEVVTRERNREREKRLQGKRSGFKSLHIHHIKVTVREEKWLQEREIG